MSLFAVVSLALIFLSAALYVVLSRRRKKLTVWKYFQRRFAALSSDNDLMFSSQEFLQNGAMGFDGIHRRLILLVRTGEGSSGEHILSLNDIKSCSLIRVYRTRKADGLEQETLDHYLEKLSLCFEYKGRGASVQITFYDRKAGDLYQMKALIRKATDWQVLLSKMLTNSVTNGDFQDRSNVP